MRQFAVIKDVNSNETFAIIVKDDDFVVCHGVHPAGKQWAESYNKGLTKSIMTIFNREFQLDRLLP